MCLSTSCSKNNDDNIDNGETNIADLNSLIEKTSWPTEITPWIDDSSNTKTRALGVSKKKATLINCLNNILSKRVSGFKLFENN